MTAKELIALLESLHPEDEVIALSPRRARLRITSLQYGEDIYLTTEWAKHPEGSQSARGGAPFGRPKGIKEKHKRRKKKGTKMGRPKGRKDSKKRKPGSGCMTKIWQAQRKAEREASAQEQKD